MHWPSGWAEKNLPGLQRLKRHGLYFNRAYTAVTQCSPSRALMMTGRFAPINRVTRTFLWPGFVHKNRQPNIASLLKEKAGYEVVWKGKWHLSYASNAAIGNGGEDWTEADIKAMEENYGWSGWNPPDAGNAIEQWQPTEFGKFNGLATLGGADPDNDGRYVNGRNAADRGQTPGFGESVVDYLKNRAPKLGKPFCLFVSLVNPHDVYVYPHFWKMAGYKRDAFVKLGIEMPPNYADDLSTKPSVQKAARDAFNKFSPIETAQARNEYVNFYAYLNTVVDKHIMTVLDTLEETGLMDNTIILRFADHGEGGLSHGMREKAYTVYEEMIHVPLIVHNPKLFPEPRETEAFYDHLDLLPTILDLAGVANPESYALGKSIVPVMKDPSTSVQDHTIFSFDDRVFSSRRHSGRPHPRDSRRRLDLRGLLRDGRRQGGIRAVQYQERSSPARQPRPRHAKSRRQKRMGAPAPHPHRQLHRRQQFAGFFYVAARARGPLKQIRGAEAIESRLRVSITKRDRQPILVSRSNMSLACSSSTLLICSIRILVVGSPSPSHRMIS